MISDNVIKFVGKIRDSGRKKIINIPSEKFKEINKEIEYYEIYLIPIKLKKLDD